MIYTAEQLMASNQSTVHTLKGLTLHAYSGFDKLVQLNLATSKAVLGLSLNHLQAALGAKDAYELFALRTELLQSLTDKTNAYGQHVHALSIGTGAEFSKACNTQLKDAKAAFIDALETLAKNAPAGSDSALSAFSNAIKVSKSLFESAQSSA